MAFRDLDAIGEMFRELSSAPPVHQLAVSKRARKSECERERIHDMRDFQPAQYRALLDKMNAYYHARKSDPEWLAKRRERGRLAMREKRAANKRARTRVISQDDYARFVGIAYRKLRVALGISAYRVAKSLKWTTTDITRFERGLRGDVRVGTFFRLAQVLGCQPSKIIREADRLAYAEVQHA